MTKWPVFEVPREVLVETEDFLRKRGKEQLEGMALWCGVESSAGHIRLTRVVIPEQVAVTDEFGSCVDMTPEAHYTLPDNLLEKELFYVRVHSHPRRAYHSERDDANQVLTHEGALSVVVPDFCTKPIRFDNVAVFRLLYGRGWVELSQREVVATFVEAHD